jgi:hypothetical protein
MVNKLFKVLWPIANKDTVVVLPFTIYSYCDTWIQISRIYYFYEIFNKGSLIFAQSRKNVVSGVNGGMTDMSKNM